MSPGCVSRVTVDLATQQNEDSGCYGKQCQDNAQTAHRDKCGQARENEPYSQQQETDISIESHIDAPGGGGQEFWIAFFPACAASETLSNCSTAISLL